MELNEFDKETIIAQANKVESYQGKLKKALAMLEDMGYIVNEHTEAKLVGYARQAAYLLEDYQVARKDITVSILLDGYRDVAEIEFL